MGSRVNINRRYRMKAFSLPLLIIICSNMNTGTISRARNSVGTITGNSVFRIKNYNATESFHNQTNQSALNSGILHLNWFEPFGPFIISATANSIINNKKY